MTVADWLRALDPALTGRATRAAMVLATAERDLRDAVESAMVEFLRAATVAVLGPGFRPPAALLAAATDPPPVVPPNLDAWPPDAVWHAAVVTHIEPVVSKVFGEAFAAQTRDTPLSDTAARLSYMENVFDRLSPRLWPGRVFEEVRFELLEALTNGETLDQIRDRIGAVTNIDAFSRRVRADINHNRAIRDSLTTRDEDKRTARAALRELYPTLDDTDTMWHYQARRVARTEAHAAMNAGTQAGVVARTGVTGEALYKQWLATHDRRTRDTHVVADGQIVGLEQPFDVGGFPLMFPGEAGGPAQEVINCRCVVLYLDADEASAAGHIPAGPAGGV